MGVYFLLEGSKSEPILYPNWMKHLAPKCNQKESPDEVGKGDYYIVSGYGYPSIFKHIENSIKDVNSYTAFKHLVISIDTDERNPENIANEVLGYIRDQGFILHEASLHIIAQHRCIETWLLGNKKMICRSTRNAELAKLIRDHNLIETDPEQLVKPQEFNTHSQFHLKLIKLIFEDRNAKYSKRNPGEASKRHYLNQIINTHNNGQLKSLQTLLNVTSLMNS